MEWNTLYIGLIGDQPPHANVEDPPIPNIEFVPQYVKSLLGIFRFEFRFLALGVFTHSYEGESNPA